MTQLTIVGGGIAGLAAAITAAEQGLRVRLMEARAELGGRAQSTSEPYRANLGPHALYSDGTLWGWLEQRGLTPPVARPPLKGMRWYADGKARSAPPAKMMAKALAARRLEAPATQDFRSWLAGVADESTAARVSAASGVFAFTHDPGALSAQFVWERARRVLLRFPPAARYPIGGWNVLLAQLSRHAELLGIQIERGNRVETLPEPPVILATELPAARRLLGDPALDWESGHTLCLDLGLITRRRDPFIVSDLDSASWIERFSAADPSLAPDGHELVQAQMPLRPAESPDEAEARLAHILDTTFADWRQRSTWKRRLIMRAQTGALDRPGTTWRDRPAIDRGDGVFVIGDMVAAPGLLAEVSLNSAVTAAHRCAEMIGGGRSRRSGAVSGK